METFQVARPRTPTAVLELKGAFKKDPKRKKAREGEPVVEAPIGVPPKHIGEVAKSVWRRVAKVATWLTEADRDALEIYCGLKAEAEVDLTEMAASRISLLNKYQNDLGLTAVARSKVKAPEKPPEVVNPFAMFN
jgi:phage terminase small subunit